MNTSMQIDVYSILGQKVTHFDVTVDRNPVTLNVEYLPAGVYYGHIHAIGSDDMIKFVVVD